MAFKLDRVAPMFPSPLAIFEVGDAAELNARLQDEIEARRAAEPSVQRSNRKGWHSKDDLFKRKEPGHRALVEEIKAMAAEATRQVAPGQDLSDFSTRYEGWINANDAGAYNTPHDHPGAFWSGCYYVRVASASDPQSDAGAIEFIDSRPMSRYAGMIPSAMTADKVKVRPRAGMCLLFPGDVKHWVYPHDDPGGRVTVAFNLFYERKR